MSIVSKYRNAGLIFVEDDKFKIHAKGSEYHPTPADLNKVNNGDSRCYGDEVVEFAWRTNTGAGTSYCGDIEYEMRSGDVYIAASQNVALSAKNAGKFLVVKWRPVLLNQAQVEADKPTRTEGSTAAETLKTMGYSWNGDQLWKPPLGKSPSTISFGEQRNNRYYIAGPMTGYDNFNREAFNTMASELNVQGHTVLNPAILPNGLTQAQYMDICLAMLRCATHVKMLKGWERSEGARIEHALAIKSDLTVEYER